MLLCDCLKFYLRKLLLPLPLLLLLLCVLVYFSQKWLPVTTSSHRRRKSLSLNAATLFQSSTRKIQTGGWVRSCVATRHFVVFFPRHMFRRILIKCRQSVTDVFSPVVSFCKYFWACKSNTLTVERMSWPSTLLDFENPAVIISVHGFCTFS